jgi:hypothetical protein
LPHKVYHHKKHVNNSDSIRIGVLFQVSGKLTNLGNDVTFFVSGSHSVTISLGPLPYVYKLSQIKFHFGRKEEMGTEHTIDGKRFDAEVMKNIYQTQ